MTKRVFSALATASILSTVPVLAAETQDATPRIAVISAFAPEWVALQAVSINRRDYEVNGTAFAHDLCQGVKTRWAHSWVWRRAIRPRW